MSAESFTPGPGARVPIVLLTGFLGSGKTSLLNRLMSARPQSRGKLAIVVNEFGEVGIDGDLLPAGMTRQVELPGGCICCVLNEDLDKTLNELLDSTPGVELIIIETTGVAEPLPIAWTVEREPLGDRVRLAAVITVVDALEFLRSRPLSVAVDAQVEYADLLVVSKLDLVDRGAPAGQPPGDVSPELAPGIPGQLDAALTALNPTAARVTGTPAQVVEFLWRALADPDSSECAGAAERGPAARSSIPPPRDRRSRDEPGATALPAASIAHSADVVGQSHAPGHPDALHVHRPAHGFESLSLPIEKTIDFEELSSQLEELPSNYVRIKGIAWAIDESTGSSEPRWIAFHRVGTRVSCEPLPGPAARRVVALGRALDRDRLAACLNAAVVRSD